MTASKRQPPEPDLPRIPVRLPGLSADRDPAASEFFRQEHGRSSWPREAEPAPARRAETSPRPGRAPAPSIDDPRAPSRHHVPPQRHVTDVGRRATGGPEGDPQAWWRTADRLLKPRAAAENGPGTEEFSVAEFDGDLVGTERHDRDGGSGYASDGTCSRYGTYRMHGTHGMGSTDNTDNTADGEDAGDLGRHRGPRRPLFRAAMPIAAVLAAGGGAFALIHLSNTGASDGSPLTAAGGTIPGLNAPTTTSDLANAPASVDAPGVLATTANPTFDPVISDVNRANPVFRTLSRGPFPLPTTSAGAPPAVQSAGPTRPTAASSPASLMMPPPLPTPGSTTAPLPSNPAPSPATSVPPVVVPTTPVPDPKPKSRPPTPVPTPPTPVPTPPTPSASSPSTTPVPISTPISTPTASQTVSQTPATLPPRTATPPPTPIPPGISTPNPIPTSVPSAPLTPLVPTIPPLARTLTAGMSGPDVSALQARLDKLVWPTWIAVTGVYDPDTSNAVAHAQRILQITADPAGVYGPATRAALTAVPA